MVYSSTLTTGMNYFSTWGEAFRASFQNLWFRFANFIPQLLGAILILVVGWLIAILLARLVRRLIEYTRLDNYIQRTQFARMLQERGRKASISGLGAWIVKWFIILVALVTASEVLGIDQVSTFLDSVMRYIPNVIVAVVILLIGSTAGGFLQSVVEAAVVTSRIPNSSAKFLGTLSKWALIIFALMAALVQLGVASSLIQILFTGLVGMLAIAGGLAFGLGGREKANKWLGDIERSFTGTPGKT